jgi:transposase
MLGHKERNQLELYMCGSLRQLVPDDHVLARVDRVLDLSWLHEEVGELYSAATGRPGIDPEVAVRLMLAGFLLGIVHDRRLLREAQVNIAIRWFIGYGLEDALPDHSSLTRIRQRWGAERFRQIFERTVKACVSAGIARGEIVHVDASLIRANVSWESLAVRHVEAVGAENGDADEESRRRKGRQTGKYKKVCLTDPDAGMATNARNRRLEPSYKQHGVVDDLYGVVLDVEVTTGEVNEGEPFLDRLDAAAELTGKAITTVTADAGYAYAKLYAGLEQRGIAAVIPAKAEPIRSPVPMRRFKYDAKHDVLKCPRGKVLKAGRSIKHGRFFTSRARDCRGCDLARLCLSGGRTNKAVVLGNDYPPLLRARRRRERWSDEDRRLYQRHRWRSEGYHGEAKTWHGLARAVRRGLQNMRIQAFLTAAAVNLKRLAVTIIALLLVAAACLGASPGSPGSDGSGMATECKMLLRSTLSRRRHHCSTAPACTSCAMRWRMCPRGRPRWWRPPSGRSSCSPTMLQRSNPGGRLPTSFAPAGQGWGPAWTRPRWTCSPTWPFPPSTGQNSTAPIRSSG